jgi:biotin-dependent carboxylase-like uncharacterized protein
VSRSADGREVVTELEVVATGPLATIQDLGRPGHTAWGVPLSGAVDRRSLRLGNRLVGNAEDAAGVEVTFGGARFRAGADVVLAVTGAPGAVTVGGVPAERNAPITVPAGEELALDAPSCGVRTYLCVRGGITVPTVLGSRATDLLAGLGPAVLQAGDRLPVGRAPGEVPDVEVAPVHDPPSGEITLRVRLGPRDDWFTPDARDTLLSTPWTVTTESNRVGVRLDGTELERAVTDELPTEGMALGALQVPPSGRPTIFLADHPVTGGYPVIAVLLDADVDAAAQLRPGQTLRFRTNTSSAPSSVPR